MEIKTHCACGQRLVPGHHHLYGLWGMWCLLRGDCPVKAVSPVESEIEELKARISKLEQKVGALSVP